MIQEIIPPVTQKIREKEVENSVHSEVLTRLTEWLPDALAFLISFTHQTDTEDERHHLLQLEQGLFRLKERIIN